MSDYDTYLQSFDPANDSVESDFRPYGLATIIENRMGHLEIWQGKRTYLPADVYVQVDTDIDAVTDFLPDSERETLDRLRMVETYFVPDGYFPERGKVDSITIQDGVYTAVTGDANVNIYAPLGAKYSVISDDIQALNGGMPLPKANDYLHCGVTHFRGKVAGILVRDGILYLVEMNDGSF